MLHQKLAKLAILQSPFGIKRQIAVKSVLLINLYSTLRVEFVRIVQSLVLFGTKLQKLVKNVQTYTPSSTKLPKSALEKYAQLDKNGT